MSLFDDIPDDIEPNDPFAGLDPAMEEGPTTLQDPMQMGFCLGHKSIENKLLDLNNQNCLPHGLVFAGIKGIGKSTFAFRLAKFLLTQKTDPNQNSLFGGDEAPIDATSFDTKSDNQDIRLLLAGAHPDVLIAKRAYDEKKNKYKDALDVAEIRKITPFLRKTSSEGGWRIVIVDDADTMNRNAQNAILKILEEPPKRTIIILIAHRVGNLIPTIRSRTQTFTFSPLSKQNMGQLLSLSELQPSNDEQDTLIEMADGSMGKAIELLEEEGLEMLATTLQLLGTLPALDWEKIHKTADGMSRMGQDKPYKMFQNSLTYILWTLTRAKGRGADVPAALSSLQNFYNKHSLQSLIDITDGLAAHFDQSNHANLDKKQTILHAMTLIAA